MAPTRTKTSQSARPSVDTPPKGIQKKKHITRTQKQALIDNLQLEITERARKLRAQYALQAHTLRSRVELRVNRIPMALRKVKIRDLLLKYATAKENEARAVHKPTDKSPAKPTTNKPKQTQVSSPVLKRGMKRASDAMNGEDKENTPDPIQGVPNQKKRPKAEPAAARQARDVSNVLSPKSSNSRQLPRSPARPQLLTQKSADAARPTSPLKPVSPVKAATAAATSMLANMVNEKTQNVRANTAASRRAAKPAEGKAAVSRAKRAPAATGDRVPSSASNTSGSSVTSTGTTIVKRVGRALNVSNTTVKKAAPAKKAAVTKAKAGPAAATGKRVLRKRN